MSAAVLPPRPASPAAAPAVSANRLLVGLAGILIAAMMAGLNNRVGALALADVRGALGFGMDDASWLTTAYNVGEVLAMPFSAWFAITLSVRRFELWMIGVCSLLAACLPFIHDLGLLLTIRFLQGIASGTMIPVLMMAALKFLTPDIRLHGLALYALTATFAPNLSIWLAGYWTDGLFDWRWVYWQILPFAAIAALLIGWGLPKEPIQRDRFPQADWVGMACGVPAFALIAIALDQGERLDWLNSPLIASSLVAGSALLGVHLLLEWYHPTPFIKWQMLGRRNLGIGFTLFVVLLLVMASGSLLPMRYLGALQDYRQLQMAPIGLIVALPQLILGSLVALLLYRKWVDARVVFAGGLLLIALACFLAARLTSDWNRDQFILAQTLQAFGQPMAVVSMLFLCTSVVHPSEGSYVSGSINTLRALGSLSGGAVVGHLLTIRQRFHAEMLLDHAALASHLIPVTQEPAQLMGVIGPQAWVLSIADAYRVLGVLALLMVPFVLCMAHIPAPNLQPPTSRSTSSPEG
ncbi:MFS transporter [Castellaniella sp.]|uniref:MFS transporter n=1 Tax=Castellaniella sp. TaxID=1955812 RepID=UPI003C75C6ED